MGNCCKRSYRSEDDDDQSMSVPLGSENVTRLESIEQWEEKVSEANGDGKMVVIMFSASWCGPCRGIAPKFYNLAAKYESLVFLSVDVDELAEFSTSWDIKATPTFIFLRDGRLADKIVGSNEGELINKIDAAANSCIQLR